MKKCFWKPHTSDYVAAGAFFSRKMAPIFLEAAGSVVGVGVGCRLTKDVFEILNEARECISRRTCTLNVPAPPP